MTPRGRRRRPEDSSRPNFDPEAGQRRRSNRRRAGRPAGAATDGAAADEQRRGAKKKRPAQATAKPASGSNAAKPATTPAAAGAGAGTGSVSFADTGLCPELVGELARQGITEPFPIQAAAIPDGLAGKDILGRGPTGSGKTFTFGLPMLQRLAEGGASVPGHPRGLVLEPTRELATQVAERLAEPAAALGLRVIDVVGGVNIKRNITALAAPVDVLVATPGRAQDLVNQGYLHFDRVEITAVDEADQMADMGFLPQVTKLMDLTPAGQRMLFSATLDGEVQTLVKRYLKRPVTHSTAPVEGGVDTMTHYRLLVGDRDNRTTVSQWIGAREGRTIMFMRTRHAVDRQVKKLRRVGIEALGIHGDKGQTTRQNALGGFKDGSTTVLVATDIAARGIDIADVSLVVHVDPPVEHKAYLHRAGRTARGGAAGTVVTLVTDEQRDDVDKLFRKAGVTATELPVTDPADPKLAAITGARKPTGAAVGPPPGSQPKRRRPRQGQRGGSGRGQGGANRSGGRRGRGRS